jgi:diguanylate cyclase (GGDEF)-like protein/PAS domain S-box-containing protein
MNDLDLCKLAILCVDDDALVLSSLSEQLSHYLEPDIAIEVATSGEEALQLLALLHAEGIELALLVSDQQMLGMTGDELIQQVYGLSPNTLTILLTGTHQVEALGKAINLGNLYRYIPKPWDEADLILTVKEAIRRYRQDREIANHQHYLQAANAELASSVSLLRATLEAAADGILVMNNQGQITHANRKLLDFLGLSPPIASDGVSPTQLAQLQSFVETPQGPWQKLLSPVQNETAGEWIALELPDGRLFECHGQIQRLEQSVEGCVWSIRDMTERHRASELIHYQAHHDALTGLCNRTQFMSEVETLLQAAQTSRQYAVLFLDLDRFKTVNDTLGHSLGDCLLQQVVQRLQGCCRAGDIISRWGGDEFTIITPRVRDRQDAATIARRLLDSLQPSFEIDSHSIRTTASIGIALYPEDGETVEILLKHADAALYKAKESGKNTYRYYTADLSDRAHERLRLETAMYQSLKAQDFFLHYQPQIDTDTGEITHLEALVRWNHPTLGCIAPSVFIDMAEQNGLIIPLGNWVIKTALMQLHQWQSQGFSSIKMGINLSPCQLQSPNLLPTLKHLLLETGIAPQSLELEVTETAMVKDFESARTLLTQLRELGISIALDDFGTGYASLTYLQQLPFNTLKIDRSFVSESSSQPQLPSQSKVIIEAVLVIGRGLKMRVIAEGVETEIQQQQLRALGCRYMQGYLFSRPLPAEQISALLQSSYRFPAKGTLDRLSMQNA